MSIGERAFFSRYALKTITLPESLESVGVEAFAWTSISNLYLPGNLETIEESAFGGLSLDTIAVSPENSQFCVEDGMLLSADKTRLLAVGSKICDVRIADSIRKVDGYALDGADSMLSLHIGAGVTSLGQYQIMIQGQRLESITVSQNNPVFSAQDGVLFNKSGSELLVYPKCKPEAYYVVPSNVVTIAQAALGGVYILRELVLSPSMKELQPYGISCNTLERVVIPANIKTIGEQAIQFYNPNDYQNLTIVGAKNSAAQTFAKKIGCKFEVLDANNCPHILMLVPGREATFGNEGCKEHYACTQCGQLFADAEGTKKLTLQDVTLPKLQVEGATGVCGDDLTWKFTKGVFTISGTGAMWSYGYNYDEAAGTISTAAPWANFGIKKVVAEEGVTEIGSYAFIGFSTLTAVELPSTLEAVGESAFDSCNLKSLTLPENLQRLGNYAFFANFAIKGTLEIPASLTEIQAGALSANNITAFEVDPANLALRSVGGAVYSEDLTVLYAYPSGVNGTWTVADGVETIQESALVYYGGTSGKPTILSIPESVETVCGMSWDWPSLKTILYGGTLAQWEALVEKTQRSYWVYLPENVTVVASDGANNAYRLTYENIFDDVINPNPPIGEFNKALTLKNPTRPGYGWYYEEDFSGKKVTSIPKTNQEDVTLYAKWTPISYTIAFNGNGSKSGKMANLAVNYDEEQQLTANAFVRPGYTFAGWATEENGSVVYTNKQKVTNLCTEEGAVLDLYAVWTPVEYKITYKNVVSLETAELAKTFNIRDGLELEAPAERPGMAFEGWYLDAKFKTPVEELPILDAKGKVKAANITLYAKWSGTGYKYTIHFEGNGATSSKIADQKGKVNGKEYTLPNCAFKRTGYTFLGWALEAEATEPVFLNKAKVANLAKENGEVIILYAVWKANS